MKINYADVKKMSIVDYLGTLGISPVKIRGADHWYLSPFRAEKDPSFKINDKFNVWFDHGAGVGGTIIDLGMNLFNCSAKEFIERLSSQSIDYTGQHQQKYQRLKESKIEIVAVSQLRKTGLLQYLKERKIPYRVAEKYCNEVTFRIGTRSYDAIGFQNDAKGHELRNFWFKGSSSPKDITLINNGSATLSVTEGIFDMLSLHCVLATKRLSRSSDFLVLNSLSFVKRSIPILSTYKEVHLFLDNDSAGQKAKTILASEGVQFKDRSDLYKDFKDLNDYLRYGQDRNQHLGKGRTTRF